VRRGHGLLRGPDARVLPLFAGAGSAPAPPPPRLSCIAADGRHAYVLGAAGLLKYCSGHGRTLGGHLYACRAEWAWIACARGRLYVRSPALAPDAPAVVDCDLL
jgi:hypothetical protein